MLGLRAAASLAERALPNGVIQVIGALDDPEHRGRTIVDTWPNLLLLWWAERQGMAGAGDAAAAHLEATLPALLRDDGSTFHAARLADDGAVLERGTINGYRRRLDLGARAGVGDPRPRLRPPGDRRLPRRGRAGGRLVPRPAADDRVPPWDFDAPRGTARATHRRARSWRPRCSISAGRTMRARLVAALVTPLNPGDADGVLLHCCYRQPLGHGLDCATVWGDFFLLDALKRIEAPDRRLDPLS